MKSRILRLVAVGLLAGLLVALEARAVSISAFSYLGDDGTTLTFALPAQPINPPQVLGGFNNPDVDIVLNGTPTIASYIGFFTPANGGGFSVQPVDAPGFGAFGPVVFSGTTTAPTFVDGVYEMLDFLGLRQGTMTIASSVPEPGTLTLLGLGLAGLGLIRRRKTNQESGDGAVTTVTFEEKGDKTLLVLHELYPSKEALDDAIAGMENGCRAVRSAGRNFSTPPGRERGTVMKSWISRSTTRPRL